MHHASGIKDVKDGIGMIGYNVGLRKDRPRMRGVITSREKVELLGNDVGDWYSWD